MQRYKDRFDDAMLRADSEKEVLPPGSDSAKVRAGKVGEFGWSDEVVEMYDRLWQTHVEPVTGYDSYASLVKSLIE